ncbi:MAG: putative 2-aminoethylphosphonate ABC transporter ATP-binding protein [Deltaproteobacteria bacterium]|nr:putative 2-aminoethylphosphonate ABC transporter ATP-binding protein [Deltaproteobacteria bacterium]
METNSPSGDKVSPPRLPHGNGKRGIEDFPVAPEEPYLQARGITKRFGRSNALRDVSFQADKGEFLCVLGPSGCGKTTLLRIIAGLEKQDAGSVHLRGEDFSNVPVSKRNVGIVFQSYALFPNLTAAQNIAYGLRIRSRRRASIQDRVESLLRLMGLSGFGSKFPAQLSGGQQQRVALARAMALSPHLLLLDEPLSALDAQVRLMLRGEVKQLQRRLNITTLMVTHDQEEALTMADRILVMEGGEVVQIGTPMEIYEKPATPFVASFVGSMNFMGRALKETHRVYRLGEIRLHVSRGDHVTQGSHATIAIRPEDIVVNRISHSQNSLSTKVVSLEFRGPLYRATLSLPLGAAEQCLLQADIPTEKIRRFGISENGQLDVELPSDRIHVYAA